MDIAKGRKVSKQAVDYRRAPDREGTRSCGNCSMYRPGHLPADKLALTGSCTHVRGIISDVMLCNDWEART